MGRKQDPQSQTLEIKIPPLFRCPISLDVMRSPVSLCTGVTYDRASIQRWLDSGHTTCPATMLPLATTDLVPNLTLHRLISVWSDPRHRPLDLLAQIQRSPDPLPALTALKEFFNSDEVEDFEKTRLVSDAGAAAALGAAFRRAEVQTAEKSLNIFRFVLESELVDQKGKRKAVQEFRSSDLEGTLEALVRVLRAGNRPEDAAVILGDIFKSASWEEQIKIAQNEAIVEEIVKLIGSSSAAVECLAAVIMASKRLRPRIVAMGAVPMLIKVIKTGSAVSAEKALRILEAAAGCAEGRAAICGEPTAVSAVVGSMMKVNREGSEAAAAVLWSVCVKFSDRRAVEAVAAAEGAATKLLLLMQSGCSPAARQMAAELLKVFKVSAKGCLPRYDTKITHIMPF